MTAKDLILAVVAGAPLTSVGGVWILALVFRELGQKLSIGRALGALALMMFNGGLIGATALCTYRGYVSYDMFHPYGWVWGFGILWFVLLVLFYCAGSRRQSVGRMINDVL